MDKKRILAKIGELASYKRELEDILPGNFEDYVNSRDTRRACERLVHIMIETVIDTSGLIVKEMKLGLPGGEVDIFLKLRKRGIINKGIMDKLKRMKGFRNILVHRYSEIDDELVFEFLKKDLKDFDEFSKSITSFLKKQ